MITDSVQREQHVKGEDRARYASWNWAVVATVCLAFMLLLLSYCYGSRLPLLVKRNNLWFGSDIARHIRWLQGVRNLRSHWHPLSFLCYLSYGKIIGVLGGDLREVSLGVASLPFIILACLGIGATAQIMAQNMPESRTGNWMWFLVPVILGPLTVFAPVPESHISAGIFLLCEAAVVFAALRKLAVEQNVVFARTGAAVGLVLAAFAAGFSIDSVLPGGLILLPLLSRQELMWNRWGRVLLFTTGILVTVVLLYVLWRHSSVLVRVRAETNWMSIPSLESVWMSLKSLVLQQFGVPATEIAWNKDPFLPGLSLMPRVHIAWLQVGAFVCWAYGLVTWFAHDSTPRWQRHYVIACATAISLMVCFHSAYDTNEAYIFAPQTWPFVVLPALIAFGGSVGRLCRFSLATCFCLAAIQSCLGLGMLVRNLGAIRGMLP